MITCGSYEDTMPTVDGLICFSCKYSPVIDLLYFVDVSEQGEIYFSQNNGKWTGHTIFRKFQLFALYFLSL